MQVGSTADLTLPENNPKMFIFKCLKCGFIKRYKNNPDYNLWMENPESVVEVYDFSVKKDFNVKKKLEEIVLTKRDRRAIKQKTETGDCLRKLDGSDCKLNDLMEVDDLENKVILKCLEISWCLIVDCRLGFFIPDYIYC